MTYIPDNEYNRFLHETAPPVLVVVISYNRPYELGQVLLALDQKLIYSNLYYVVADDASPLITHDLVQGIGNRMQKHRNLRLDKATENGGWGKNANRILKSTSSDYVLLIEDDYVLTEKIDLHPIVFAMEHNPQIGLMRLDGPQGHRFTRRYEELPAPGLELRKAHPNTLPVFIPFRSSRELHLYSNRPHLKHRRFHETYGFYYEGAKLGNTEVEMALRVKHNAGPDIAIPTYLWTQQFEHIGKSYQNTEHDKGV